MSIAIVVLQPLNRAWFFVTPWTAALQASLSFTISEFAQTYVPLFGDAIQPSPLLSPSPPAFNLSQNQGFSNESVLRIRWPKYWSFSFSISLSNEYYELISFRIEQFDVLAVQGTLKSLLQHHSSKASILGYSPFFMVQLSHPYMTTGKTIAFTIQNFVTKMMSLLFNMLSRFRHSFPSKEQVSFKFMAVVTISSDFGAKEIKSATLFPCFPCLFAMKWWDWMPWP